MLASPTCGASMDAIKDIEADSPLRKALLGRLAIISSPSGALEAKAFADWNRRHPQFQQTQAFGSEDWPEVSDWENYPAFYFISQGKVVGYRLGWGPGALDGIKSELRKLDANPRKQRPSAPQDGPPAGHVD